MKTPLVFAFLMILTPISTFAIQREYLHLQQRQEQMYESKRLANEDYRASQRDRASLERMPSSGQTCTGAPNR